jgi:hypothetical protein
MCKLRTVDVQLCNLSQELLTTDDSFIQLNVLDKIDILLVTDFALFNYVLSVKYATFYLWRPQLWGTEARAYSNLRMLTNSVTDQILTYSIRLMNPCAVPLAQNPGDAPMRFINNHRRRRNPCSCFVRHNNKI